MANLNLKAIISAEDRTSRAFGSLNNGFNKLAKVGLAGAVAGFGALAVFAKKSVSAFAESQKVTAQTNAVLKSTKGIAGLTAKEIGKLSASLQKVTKYGDEEIQSGENLLLTFTKIGKDIFPEATKTMLDMSTALGQDLKSSAIQLGKALQDPILGITALRRVGVNFNNAQKETVKRLVESGQMMKAQKFILAELKEAGKQGIKILNRGD